MLFVVREARLKWLVSHSAVRSQTRVTLTTRHDRRLESGESTSIQLWNCAVARASNRRWDVFLILTVPKSSLMFPRGRNFDRFTSEAFLEKK